MSPSLTDFRATSISYTSHCLWYEGYQLECLITFQKLKQHLLKKEKKKKKKRLKLCWIFNNFVFKRKHRGYGDSDEWCYKRTELNIQVSVNNSDIMTPKLQQPNLQYMLCWQAKAGGGGMKWTLGYGWWDCPETLYV